MNKKIWIVIAVLAVLLIAGVTAFHFLPLWAAYYYSCSMIVSVIAGFAIAALLRKNE